MMSKENRISWLMLLALFAYMFMLNYFMPMHRDDFEYSLIWNTDVRIASFADVFESLYRHYMQHGGRMTDYLVNDTLAWWGKQWFNPFNAFLYVYLMILVYWHAKREITWRFNPYILGMIIVFAWFGLPDWALTTVWMNGSCVYLVSSTLIFSMLLPYHMQLVGREMFKDGYIIALFMLVFGVAAAWTIENTAASMNLLILLACIYAYKKGKLKKWMVTGFVGSCIGFFMLIAAPGNFVRAAVTDSSWLIRIGNQLAAGGQIFLGVLPVFLFMILCWRILLIDYAKYKGLYRQNNTVEIGLGMDNVAKIFLALVMLVSVLTNSFASKWTTNVVAFKILQPLGLYKGERMFEQLANTLSGVEEVILYLLVVTQIFNYVYMHMSLRSKDVKDYALQTTRKEIVRHYPTLRFFIGMLAIGVLNNLIMLASPLFPARAGFGTALFFMIGVISMFNIPLVKQSLLTKAEYKKFAASALLLLFVPMASMVAYRYGVLHYEDSARMQVVQRAYVEGIDTVEIPKVSVGTSVLRHVFFSELDNGVSRGGLMRYYNLKELKLK